MHAAHWFNVVTSWIFFCRLAALGDELGDVAAPAGTRRKQRGLHATVSKGGGARCLTSALLIGEATVC